MSIKIITVPADSTQPVTRDDSPDDLATLQNLVGGDIDAVGIGNCAIYFDGEGKWKNRPINIRATKLAHRLKLITPHDAIAGDVVVTGHNDETGDNADAPEAFHTYLTNVKT